MRNTSRLKTYSILGSVVAGPLQSSKRSNEVPQVAQPCVPPEVIHHLQCGAVGDRNLTLCGKQERMKQGKDDVRSLTYIHVDVEAGLDGSTLACIE
jgi:hypothetical protein